MIITSARETLQVAAGSRSKPSTPPEQGKPSLPAATVVIERGKESAPANPLDGTRLWDNS